MDHFFSFDVRANIFLKFWFQFENEAAISNGKCATNVESQNKRNGGARLEGFESNEIKQGEMASMQSPQHDSSKLIGKLQPTQTKVNWLHYALPYGSELCIDIVGQAAPARRLYLAASVTLANIINHVFYVDVYLL